MDGLILVKKHQGCTSHDLITDLRRILNIQKIGHFGTLDPLATGLMIIAVGKATRLSSFFLKADKIYEGRIQLGYSTDTYDSTGTPTSTEKKEWPEKKKILEVMKKFLGKVDQIPPPYSAKKYRGEPLYKLARKKKEFELKPSRIFIHSFLLKEYHPPFLNFEVKCSSGTYIRSLAHDLGQILRCGAHLSELTRTKIEPFELSAAFTLEKIKQLKGEGKISHFLIAVESLLPQFPKAILKESGTALARNGNMVFPENISKVVQTDTLQNKIPKQKEVIFRLFNLEGKLLGLAKKEPEKNSLHPFLVFNQRDIER
ncbi:MAG: tRNA pseudouridine(55) synthase TruB [Candidatus Aminicenantes bacterium]|nr:tRNA pseudouridine(55) synthase TruB [Candidatus Aminicenantes bacterium]